MSIQPEENTPQMIEKMVTEIKRAVDAKDFQGAKDLRDKLMESNPMAISEGIKTAEMIERGMSAAIDKDHLALWPELYDQLTTEERNCLFFSMQQYTLPENRMLLKYKSLNNRLFFLEKGRVAVAVPQDDNKFKLVAQLGQGSVLGEYTFSTTALCSASVVTKTAVQFRCLEGKQAEGWEEENPGIYAKVLDFCKKHGQIEEIRARKEQEVHQNPRHSVDGRVKAILLDKNGQTTELFFNGEIEEISRSGSSFSIHCKNSSIVKKLLTKSFSLNYNCRKNERDVKFSCQGKVVHVSSLLYNDYLLHVSFQSPLAEKLEAQIAN